MISVKEALELILRQKADFGTEKVALLQSAGRLLAEDVHADRDLPPFNRVMMDGIAIRAAAFESGRRDFTIENIQAAGQEQKNLANAEACIEVMTGAMLPENTDAVIPYEQCELSNGSANVVAETVKAGQNIHNKALDGREGDVLLQKGTKITATAIALLASAGYAQVSVFKLPKVAVCSTGDELVDVHEQPQIHQIRSSNSYMLASALMSEGIEASVFHLPDNQEELTKGISSLKKDYDALLFSGAVSKGKFDFLPDVLQMLGMHTVFHSVAQKPGKPFLLGVFDDGPIVFGFPGNPVSTFACYQLYFRNWLYASLGKEVQNEQAVFDTDMDLKAPVSQHVLVAVSLDDGISKALPILNSNSGDLGSLALANSIALFPAEKNQVQKGELVEIIRF